MMSKERELLKRVLDTQHTLSVQIAYEIQDLLAQPEQYPLSDDEIYKELKLSRRSTEWDYGFEAGVGFAEEFHGIGVDDGTH